MASNRRFVTQHGMTLKWSLLLVVFALVVWNSPSFAAGETQRLKAEAPPPPTILSIIPAQAEPGSKVRIFGAGFGDRISAYLGSIEIPATVIGGKQLEFTVPVLDAGLYTLYLKRGDGGTGRSYNFAVLQLRPVLNELLPGQIDSCVQGKDREITAVGEHFTESSMLLFDSAIIKSRVVSPETIVFTVPQVAGGLHQITVRNGPDNISGTTVALVIETKPEISQITVGNEYVNNYELLIDGRNFQQNSALYVDGHRIGGNGLDSTDRLIYVNCTRLIYLRYPYSPVNKDFHLQLINPDNEASRIVNVSAP